MTYSKGSRSGFSNGLHDIFKTSESILIILKPHILHINRHNMIYDHVKILIFTIFFAKNSEKKFFFCLFLVRHFFIYR